MIEADMVCNPQYAMDTDTIAGGVEVDENNAPKFYHIMRRHPGGFIPLDQWDAFYVFGPESGRRQILHLFDRERPGQRRGFPMLAPVFESLKQITRLTESELMAAVVTSFFTAAITSDRAQGDVVGNSYDETESVKDGRAGDANVVEMGHGSILSLVPGETVQTIDPKRPNGAFAPFFQAIVTEIGAAVEQPYEVVMQHFTASYSASRAALLEAWKFYKSRRAWLVRGFCQPVYEAFLIEAISKRRIEAPGFFSDPALMKAWCGSKWSGPGQGELDPMRETQARVLKIESNLSTHTKEVAEIDGDNWEQVASTLGRERKRINELGLNVATGKVATPKEEQDSGENKLDETGDREDLPPQNKDTDDVE
jgi:lambda family phage portal protein